MFFSNTNRTNLTNCLGYDPVCIRGIRWIRGQLISSATKILLSNLSPNLSAYRPNRGVDAYRLLQNSQLFNFIF